ncbi:MAG: competence/damage-inducible protein A [Bacteroidetes bacterium]|nr:MAG: competence/damage-inducible protein A [Bacteroidota bacterium]
MKADIITIGDEILIGQITDTNSVFIAEKLNNSGFEIRQITSVSDNKEHIITVLDEVSKYTDLVVITGGLGPTEDDLTKQTLADYFGSKLILNEDVLEDVKQFVRNKGFTLNERNIKQAEIPDNCKIIRNKNGTAAGMWFEKDDTVFISMPAVPFEMKEMFEVRVLPLLKEKFKLPKVIHKNILTYGFPESSLAEKLSDWEQNLHSKISLAYLPSPERIRLRLSMICDSEKKAEDILDAEIEKLKGFIGENIYGYGDMFLQDAIAEILKNSNLTVSTAESCTSGNIARLITSVPGSSSYFKGGIAAYSNDVKTALLKVSEETLEKYGAVSKEVVEQMVKGQLELFNTDYGIAVSGIAGPDGGTEEKPVGTTWIAIGNNEKIIAKKYTFGTRRLLNVRFASTRAMDNLRRFILGFDIN